MRQANENARLATHEEPLLDKIQPKPPGVDENSIAFWWAGRSVVEASEEEDLKIERFRPHEAGLRQEIHERKIFYVEASKVGELTLAYRFSMPRRRSKRETSATIRLMHRGPFWGVSFAVLHYDLLGVFLQGRLVRGPHLGCEWSQPHLVCEFCCFAI